MRVAQEKHSDVYTPVSVLLVDELPFQWVWIRLRVLFALRLAHIGRRVIIRSLKESQGTKRIVEGRKEGLLGLATFGRGVLLASLPLLFRGASKFEQLIINVALRIRHGSQRL